MKRQKKNKFTNLITWVLLLLLLFGIVGGLLHVANIGKDDIVDIVKPSFRVECDGNVYRVNTNNIFEVPKSGQVRFDVKNCKDCSVKVLSNVTAETDFTFTVNGQEKKYSEIGDLTSAFIKPKNVYGDYFIIDFDDDYSLKSIISRLYNSEDITISEHDSFPLYKLVVTSSDEVIEIILYFGVEKVELPESIVF